jgi:hypothetical protein
MSYDLYILRKDEIGDDPSAAYERLEEQEERKLTPGEERQLRKLAADLEAANPGVDLVESDKGFFLQLGYEAARPVVIDIGANETTMSWSYGADDAGPALAEVRLYLPVFERHGYSPTIRSLSGCSTWTATPNTRARFIAMCTGACKRRTALSSARRGRGGSASSARASSDGLNSPSPHKALVQSARLQLALPSIRR